MERALPPQRNAADAHERASDFEWYAHSRVASRIGLADDELAALAAGTDAAGFSPAEIRKAFDWLDTLARLRPEPGPTRTNGPTRVFHGAELDKLDVESRGFLLFLEQHGILDADQRELVLDRAMALDQDELELDDLKWVVLMVLFNQPGSEAAYAWMETQMFLDEPEPVH